MSGFIEGSIEFIRDGGYMMFPLLVIAGVVPVLAVRSWLRLRAEPVRPDAVVETGIDAVLFWGAYGAVIGLLGTIMGVIQAAQAIALAGGVSDALLWGGIKVTLYTTLFGLFLFSIALLLWFGLRVRYRKRAMVAA